MSASVHGSRSDWPRRPGRELRRRCMCTRRRRGSLWSGVSVRQGGLPRGRLHSDDFFPFLSLSESTKSLEEEEKVASPPRSKGK